nr:trehalase family glycosidase [uncultured Marinifilum sp.]
MTQGLSALLLLVFLFACNTPNPKEKLPKQVNQISQDSLLQIYNEVKVEFKKLSPNVIQPAEGYLKYPYLIPAGFYKQMWDWDGFFMGNHFVSQGKPEYLKYWALNLIEGIDRDGYVSGCATTKGPRPIFGKFAMKPFLSQGVYFASKGMNDFSWVKEHYQALMKVLAYRDQTQLDTIYGLYYWDNAMQSGADNNPAMNYFWKEDKRSFLACDASTFQLREIIAQAEIAEQLGYNDDATMLKNKAEQIKKAMITYLWNKEDKMFYNVDRETGKHYKRVSYSCFVPLMENILNQKDGSEMINRYLLNPDCMKAKYGLRSLSKSDPDYNNKNIIVPFSNWQGPVWPIANYIYSIGLKNYGFETALQWQAATLGKLLLADIKKYESMHENYHADTGAPLAPADTHVDENGKFVGFISWNLCVQNILAGLVEDEWMLLEIE